jgi:hypothetical protein
VQALDRDEQPLEKGDRVRVVRHVGWRMLGNRRERLLGQYAYVADIGGLSVTIRLEEHPEVRTQIQPHDIALAPGHVEPEIEQPQLAQSAADVRLTERFPSTGRAQYTTWTIGEDEGTATIMHESGHWELTFAEFPGEYDGGEVGHHDDTATGAWNAWNRMHARLGG